MTRLDKAVQISDLRDIAKRRLPTSLFNQLDHGSEDDVAYQHNFDVLRKIKLIPRALIDVSKRDASVNLFGKTHRLPIVISPTGITSWLSYRGEVSLARAALKAGIPFTLTSTTATPMEEVLKTGGTQWYHAITWRDVEASLAGVKRARDAGFEALFVTVGGHVPYNRPWDRRLKVKFPMDSLKPGHLLDGVLHPSWALGTAMRYLISERSLPQMVNTAIPKNLTAAERQAWFTKADFSDWEFFRRVRDLWPRTLILKGIMHPDDAVMGVDYGADGIVVGNQGGATNDSAPSPLEVLPGVVAALGGRTTVFVDSGFRRGSDILKAIALGADAVLLGRAVLYGLGAAGEAGAHHALSLLGEEVRRTMGMLGVRTVSELGRDHIMLPGDLAHLGARHVPWKGGLDGQPEGAEAAVRKPSDRVAAAR